MRASIAACLLALSTVTGWAQGVVSFSNSAGFETDDDRLVYDWHDGQCRPLVGTNYAAGLFYLPGADQNIASPTQGIQAGGLAFFRQPTTARPGTWLNPLNVGTARILDGVPELATATLQVRVWDITRYATFAEAFNSGDYAWSAAFNYYVLPSWVDGGPYSRNMNDLRAFGCVPEPSTLGLGALGIGIAGWLFWCRNRKSDARR